MTATVTEAGKGGPVCGLDPIRHASDYRRGFCVAIERAAAVLDARAAEYAGDWPQGDSQKRQDYGALAQKIRGLANG